MKHLRKVLSVLLCIVMMASCMVPALAAPQEKVLNIGTYMAVTTLVPWKTTSDGDGYIIRQVYHTLVEMNQKSEFTPSLATSWECSEDGKTWIMHLRNDVYWQSNNDLFKGEKVQVTAEDVVYSYQQYLDPTFGSVRYSALKEMIESVEALDDFTVKFVTKDVNVLFLYYMYQNYIIPKKAIETGWDLGAYPVGSGAYEFVEHIVDTRVVLKKNPDFWKEPGLDKIVYNIITDKSVAAIALMNKEIDIAVSVLPTDISDLAKRKYLSLGNTGVGSLRWAGYNCTNELFTDPEIRRALAMAVNMDGAVNAIFKSDSGIKLAVRGYGCISPERPGGANIEPWKEVAPKYDPKGAMEILESKGWKKGSDGIYAKDGKKFSFTLQVGNNDSNREKWAVIIGASWKAIGIDCTVKTAEWGTHSNDIKDGNVDAYIIGGYSNLDGPKRLMHSDPTTFSPNCGYANPEVDALLEKAWVTVDDTARAELLNQAATIFARDCAYIGCYFEYSYAAYNNRVQDFGYPTIYQALCSTERNVTVA